MRLALLATGLLAVLLTVSPVAAHHKPGHDGGPPGERSDGSQDKNQQDNHNENNDNGPPDNAPGNSGAAHWCKGHFNDGEADWQFANHGECVSFFAHQRQDDEDNDNGTGSSTLRRGDLTIADVRVRDDGTFRARGFGAESTVQVWIDGGSDLVVGFGQADPDHEGTWTVEGSWACQDNEDPHDARVRAQDDDESDSERITFRCDDLNS